MALQTGDADHQRRLTRILHRCMDGAHLLVLSGAVEATDWFTNLVPADREWVQQAAVSSMWPSSGRVEAADTEQQIESLFEVAHRPLRVLVENAQTDGALIDAAIAAYGSERQRRLWGLSLTPPVREIEHGGGSTLPAQLERRLAEAGPGGRPPRVIVVVDSDASIPSQALADSLNGLRMRCEGANVPCWILRKREVENYVPDALFEAWLTQHPGRSGYAPAVQALRRLTRVQRDHIDVAGDRRLRPAKGPDPFFDSVTEEDRRALADKNFKRVYLAPDPAPVPRKGSIVLALRPAVLSGAVRAEDFDERDPDGELRALVDLVFREL